MAYGRVNVGGSSGLKIKSVQKISGEILSYISRETINFPQKIDSKKSIVTLEIHSYSNDLSATSIQIQAFNDTFLQLVRTQTSSEIVEYKLTIIELEGFESLTYGEKYLIKKELKFIPLPKVKNINNCLIFSTQNGTLNNYAYSQYIIEKDIILKDGIPNLSLRCSSDLQPNDSINLTYFILELK